MSEYREHWNLAADPPAAAVYARLADIHDHVDARQRLDRRPRQGVRARAAGSLRRLAAAIEPTPTIPTCPDAA